MDNNYSLQRFVDAQAKSYATEIGEIKACRMDKRKKNSAQRVEFFNVAIT